MATLAIIGGTGLTQMDGLVITRREMVKTPFGAPSCPLIIGELDGQPVAFLARHGNTHNLPPHRINYCANIWALQSVGIERIMAVGAVGGIAANCTTGAIVIPDQIIDYTYDRTNTFFDGPPDEVKHIDFSYPYDDVLRQALIKGAEHAKVSAIDHGTYGVTQGPRLETVAEVNRLERDGCTIVGMTGMPEASLARELGMDYACCAAVVNPAAGKAQGPIDIDALTSAIESSMVSARAVIMSALTQLS